MQTQLALIATATLLTGANAAVTEETAVQNTQIQQGVATGTLTPTEGYDLQRKQQQVHQLEHQFRYDGYLSPSEQAILRNHIETINRQIYQQHR